MSKGMNIIYSQVWETHRRSFYR